MAVNIKLDCNCKLAEHMRGFVPVPGDSYENLLLVNMKKGDRISPHKHVYHTVLYYPEDSEPVVVTPTAGMMIYLPANTLHEVPVTTKPRQSIAMLVPK